MRRVPAAHSLRTGQRDPGLIGPSWPSPDTSNRCRGEWCSPNLRYCGKRF